MRWLLLAMTALALASCGGNDALSAEDYGDRMGSEMRELATALETIQRLFGEAEARPALALNDAWQDNLADAADALQRAHQAVDDITPPDALDDVHALTLRATECYSDVGDEIAAELDQGSDADYGQMVALLGGCNDLMTDATDALREVSYVQSRERVNWVG